MRSILALLLAILILAGAAPGLFTESPVCAAVGGREIRLAPPAPAPAKSCCGTPSCDMRKGGACGMAHACAAGDAHQGQAASPSDAAGAGGARLCASSCGTGGVSVTPATPDPGTFEFSRTPAALFAASCAGTPSDAELPTRNPVPDDPPPRA